MTACSSISSPLSTKGLHVSALHDRISAIFLEKLHISIPSAEADLLETGILDSLQLVDLIFNLEKEFAIHISLDSLDLESFRSISRIAELIESQQR
jgi:acyl carrier protein